MELFSGIAGALLVFFLIWFKEFISDKMKKKREAEYLAIRVITALDKYAAACWTLSNNFKVFSMQVGKKNSILLPKSPVYPTDINWKSIKHDLVCEILSLHSATEFTDEAVTQSTVKLSDEVLKNHIEFFFENYITYSLRSIKISKALRKKYKIKGLEIISQYEKDLKKVLKKDKAKKEKAKGKK